MNTSLKVIFLTHHMPWPTTSGGRRREAELLCVLAPRHEIEVVAISKVPQQDRRGIAFALELGLHAEVFPAAPSRSPFASSLVRRHWAPAAAVYLARRLADDDATVIHVEGHFLMHVLPQSAWSRAMLVEHNIESSLVRQRASRARGIALSTHASWILTARTEARAWRRVAILGALSHSDAATIRRRLATAEVRVLPSGSDHLLRARPRSAGRIPSFDMLFVANFSYWPNDLAAKILVQQILPLVARGIPDVRLAITGAAPPPWLSGTARHDPRLILSGWVDDLDRWIAAAKVIVCPLWVGGGIKIKMLEAVAAGQCVVTTSIGAQGFPPAVQGALVIRDDMISFAAETSRLLASDDLRHQRRSAMRKAAAALPTWKQSAQYLEECWVQLAARQAARR